MRTILITVFLLLAIAAIALPYRNFAARSGENARETVQGAARGAKKTPIIVELFTSEGCSSCPPADELLSRLEKSQPIPGVEVIALEEHVDYWNSLGWSDPFSSSRFSERQSEYARVFRNDSVYTPQMVVDGSSEFVGSSELHAVASIVRAAGHPKIPIGVKLGSDWHNTPSTVAIEVNVEPWRGNGDTERADLLLALTEDDLVSAIDRGENAGLQEVHRAVVRQLTRLGSVDAGQGYKGTTTFTPAPGWKLENLRVVILMQQVGTARVLGTGELRLGTHN